MSPLKEASLVGAIVTVGLGLSAVVAEALKYLEKHIPEVAAITILCIGMGLVATLITYVVRKIEK